MTDHIAPEDARAALDTIATASGHVADEVGLPRAYWWGMAAGWVVLGLIGEYAPAWAVSVATLAFGAGHASIASRLLDGRSRTGRLRVGAAVASRRIPILVIGMLLSFVALTVGMALLLDVDGAVHPQIWSAGIVAVVIGLGGPEILVMLRRIFRA